MRTFLTTIVFIFAAALSVGACTIWYDGHSLRSFESNLYQHTGFTKAKSACVASSGFDVNACYVADREDRAESELE